MRFVVIGDSKGKDNGINEHILRKILKRTRRLTPPPEFIILCGDSVAGSQDDEIFVSQLEGLRELIYGYHPNILIIPAVGNHEVISQYKDDRLEKVFTKTYHDFTPDDFLKDYNKTVFFRDFDDTRLIVLNPFHCGFIHRIGSDQLDWLERTASVDKKIKILFIHSPAFPTGAHHGRCLDSYPEERDIFWRIIDRCRVSLVFSGHEHNYSRRVIDVSFGGGKKGFSHSIFQVITGGGGERLKGTYKDMEGVIVPPICEYHFVVADTDSGLISISAISTKGKKLDYFEINPHK